MIKRFKHSIYTWVLYTFFSAIVLYLIFGWSKYLYFSIILGFVFGCLNSIIAELRKLNGEKFDNLEEE